MTFPIFFTFRPMPTPAHLWVLACCLSLSCATHAAESASATASPEMKSAETAAISSEPPHAERPEEAEAEHPEHGRRIDVGAATSDLLALQRKSTGSRPRPIDGEQASRSYQRYLKSFETTIPERFETGLALKKQ